MANKFLSFLSSLDQFGGEAKFKVKKQKKYKTFLGFILTIAFFFTLIAYCLNLIRTFLVAKKPRALQQETFIRKRIFQGDFSKELDPPILWFGIQPNYNTGDDKKNRIRYFDISEMKKYLKGYAFYETKFVGKEGAYRAEYVFGKCEGKNLQDFKDHYISGGKKPVCLHRGKVTPIAKEDVKNDRNRFEVVIKYCTKNDAGCDTETLKKNEIWVGAILPAIKMDIENFKEPISETYSKFVLDIMKQPNVYNDHKVVLKEVELRNDRGGKVMNGKVHKFYDSLDFDHQNYKVNNKPGEVITRWRLRFDASYEKEEIIRRYLKLVDVLSTLGAKSRTFLLMYGIFYLFYNGANMRTHLKKSVYSMDDPDLPEEMAIKEKVSKLRKNFGKEDKIKDPLEKKQTYILKATERLYEERTEIIEKMRKKTINKAMMAALIPDSERLNMPTEYVLRRARELEDGVFKQEISIKEALRRFKLHQPKGKVDRLVQKYLYENLPESMLKDPQAEVREGDMMIKKNI